MIDFYKAYVKNLVDNKTLNKNIIYKNTCEELNLEVPNDLNRSVKNATRNSFVKKIYKEYQKAQWNNLTAIIEVKKILERLEKEDEDIQLKDALKIKLEAIKELNKIGGVY